MDLCASYACCLLNAASALPLPRLLAVATGFDAAYFNAVFGNVFDQRDELLRTALLLKPGKHTSAMQSECTLCKYMLYML